MECRYAVELMQVDQTGLAEEQGHMSVIARGLCLVEMVCECGSLRQRGDERMRPEVLQVLWLSSFRRMYVGSRGEATSCRRSWRAREKFFCCQRE